jgi:hypothetical protein
MRVLSLNRSTMSSSFFHLLVAHLDLGKTLDQVDTRTRCVEGGKHDRRRASSVSIRSINM